MNGNDKNDKNDMHITYNKDTENIDISVQCKNEEPIMYTHSIDAPNAPCISKLMSTTNIILVSCILFIIACVLFFIMRK